MDGAKFNFVAQLEKQSILTNKKIDGKLMQWSMKGNLKLKHYNFNEQFHPYQKQEFVDAFFKDPIVCATLEIYQSSSSSWKTVGDEIERVKYTFVPSTQISMSFFDRLLDPKNKIVRIGGEVHQRMEEQIHGFFVSNNLSTMLLDEECDLFGLYSQAEREEFLFRLFHHLVLGGQFCQWDDSIQPYLDITKALYKEIISVEREEGSNNIRIRSIVLKVECFDKKGHAVFPEDVENIQNFCYLIIDPFKRTATTLTHCYEASFNV